MRRRNKWKQERNVPTQPHLKFLVLSRKGMFQEYTSSLMLFVEGEICAQHGWHKCGKQDLSYMAGASKTWNSLNN